MLFQRATSLSKGGFTLENYLNIADALCHSAMEVSPVFECVKIFVRINELGNFVYARHKFDLGNSNIDRYQIVERIKNEKRREAVLEALCEVEKKCFDIWPFSQGSATWVLLEILHPDIRLASLGNKPTVIFRNANRISSKGTLSETVLTKNLFSRFQQLLEDSSGKFSLVFNPIIQLNNISGSGVYTKFREEHDSITLLAGDKKKKISEIPPSLQEHYEDSYNELVNGVLEHNFSIKTEKNPGFMFILNEQLFKVQGRLFEVERKKATEKVKQSRTMAPLPFGYRK